MWLLIFNEFDLFGYSVNNIAAANFLLTVTFLGITNKIVACSFADWSMSVSLTAPPNSIN